MNQMQPIQIVQTFVLWDTVPSAITSDLTKAVESVSAKVFFDAEDKPTKGEVVGLDQGVKEALSKSGWELIPNHKAFEDSEFSVDLACKSHKLLIEIEKGKLPRLELDIMKMVAACNQFPEKWQLGALIVPATYIKLPLEGRNTPYYYLKKRLKPLLRPLLESSKMAGLLVIGYEDPRGTKGRLQATS
jgi:hypothetical protein